MRALSKKSGKIADLAELKRKEPVTKLEELTAKAVRKHGKRAI